MRILALTFIATTLTGCAASVNIEAAAGSNDPLCAEVMVRLPITISDLEQRSTNSQATSAWGKPAAVLIRCGLEPVEISELPCVTAGEIDWLVDDAQAPNYRFISYARNPGVEVIVDSNVASGVTTLEQLAAAVKQIPQTKVCTEITD